MIARFPCKRRIHEGRNLGPDLRPDVMEACTERPWVLGTKGLGIRLVVEEAELLVLGHEHREFGAEQHRAGTVSRATWTVRD